MPVFEPYKGGIIRKARKIRLPHGRYRTVDYRLFIGPARDLFFKIVDNDDTGTHPNLYFSVSRYWDSGFKRAKIHTPIGFTDAGTTVTTSDGNASGFIKAIIRNIPEKITAEFGLALPRKESTKTQAIY